MNSDFDTWLRQADADHDRQVAGELDVDAALLAVQERAKYRDVRRRRMRGLGAAGVLVVVGGALFALPVSGLAVAYLYLVLPAGLVLLWFAESGTLRGGGWRLPPRTVAEGAHWLRQRERELVDHADELRLVRQRVATACERVADLGSRCRDCAWRDAKAGFADVGRQLETAVGSAESLVALLTECGRQASALVEASLVDPRRGYAEFARLPIVVDAGQVGNLIRSVVLVLRLAGDSAKAISLAVAGQAPCADADWIVHGIAEVTGELDDLCAEVHHTGRAVQRSCKRMLGDANALHGLITTTSIRRLQLNRASQASAVAAVWLTAMTKTPADRTATRTVFLRKVSQPGNRSGAGVARATTAAMNHRRRGAA